VCTLEGIISLILRHLFTPLNNTRLAHLCGPTDEHLRTIEQALEVRIAHRHEQFKVEGAKAKAQRGDGDAAGTVRNGGAPHQPRHRAAHAARAMATAADDDGPTLATRRADLQAAHARIRRSYLDNIAEFDITLGIGPAGTGKTYLAVAAAVDALQRSAVQRIVLTRPAVEAGERLGFLPGDLNAEG